MGVFDDITDIGKFFEFIPEIFKGVPEVIKSTIEIIGLLDDILIMAAKIAQFLFSEIPKYIMIGMDYLTKLIPIISNVITNIISILSKYRNISLILVYLSPVMMALTGLFELIKLIA